MKAVVGRIDEVGALELARVLQRVDQGRDQLVDRLQALQALAMVGRDLGDLIFVQARQLLDEAGLVADVVLVEGRPAAAAARLSNMPLWRGAGLYGLCGANVAT